MHAVNVGNGNSYSSFSSLQSASNYWLSSHRRSHLSSSCISRHGWMQTANHKSLDRVHFMQETTSCWTWDVGRTLLRFHWIAPSQRASKKGKTRFGTLLYLPDRASSLGYSFSFKPMTDETISQNLHTCSNSVACCFLQVDRCGGGNEYHRLHGLILASEAPRSVSSQISIGCQSEVMPILVNTYALSTQLILCESLVRCC